MAVRDKNEKSSVESPSLSTTEFYHQSETTGPPSSDKTREAFSNFRRANAERRTGSHDRGLSSGVPSMPRP